MPSVHRWCCSRCCKASRRAAGLLTCYGRCRCCEAGRQAVGAPSCHGSNIGAANLLRGSSRCCRSAVVPSVHRWCCKLIVARYAPCCGIVDVLRERRPAAGAPSFIAVLRKRHRAISVSLVLRVDFARYAPCYGIVDVLRERHRAAGAPSCIAGAASGCCEVHRCGVGERCLLRGVLQASVASHVGGAPPML